MLKGGRLVYSTCAQAPENEEIVHWSLDTYDFELLAPVEHVNGMVAGIDLLSSADVCLIKLSREKGQFVAHLHLRTKSAPKFKASKSESQS